MGSGASAEKYSTAISEISEDDEPIARRSAKRRPSTVSVSSMSSMASAEDDEETREDSDNNMVISGQKNGSLIVRSSGILTEHYAVDEKEFLPGMRKVTHLKSEEVHSARCICKKERSTESLDQEVRILKKMDHPNVSKLFEVFDDSSNYYLISEMYVHGALSERLASQNTLSEKITANIMRQVLRAVMYMHDQQVCHRALQPNVIMITPGPEADQFRMSECRVRVADFEHARYFDKSSKLRGMVGRAEFSSPQMILQESYSKRCDHWSAGAIMHAMLTGGGPFGPEPEGGNREARKEFMQKVEDCEIFTEDSKALYKGTSNSAKRMLMKVLTFREKDRWSIDTCLAWSWFAEQGQGLPKLALSVHELESMISFGNMNKLQKTAMHIIARRLPERETEHLRTVFESIDLDQNGVLTCKELDIALRKFTEMEDKSWRSQKAVSAYPSAKQLMAMLDSNGNDGLDFTEFVAAALPRKYYRSEGMLKAAFRALDADGSGEISLEELEEVLLEDRRGADEEELSSIREVLRAADLDGNGSIDFDEFVEMMKSTSEVEEAKPESAAAVSTPSGSSLLAKKPSSRGSSKQSTTGSKRGSSKQSTGSRISEAMSTLGSMAKELLA
eukprot:TRINITY_DN24931_c0_g1_i1.p1 TRINITY_DN24931_c0_g1~~TRINITY_DN24931_c0_g1_i1.p1  ORF type:complete len:638 (+),score=172.43 TRINITY_DN24931_c0_g1_i1:62-1915(+)